MKKCFYKNSDEVTRVQKCMKLIHAFFYRIQLNFTCFKNYGILSVQ